MEKRIQNQNAQKLQIVALNYTINSWILFANLETVEDLSKDSKYKEAFKQLSTGNDNLVVQATKLKT
jgi:predicted porin